MPLPTVLIALFAAAAAAQTPQFEVASVKPCTGAEPADGKSGGGGRTLSPGLLHLECTSVMGLIQQAYVLFANGHVNPRSRIPIEGGPAWIRSESYRIDAKPESAQGQGMMRGPMLQNLLEERFHLKIRRETREVPAYALTIAKGGPKLRAFHPGTCVPLDLKILDQFPPPPFPELPAGQQYCGGTDPSDGTRWVAAVGLEKGPNKTIEARAMSLDDFVRHALGPHLDRPVLNRTRIQGMFDFHLEFVSDDALPDGPAIAAALKRQLGLGLEPAKAPGEVLVIDGVEKPR